MVDFEKDNFTGAAALKQRRAAGLKQKIVGVAAETDANRSRPGRKFSIRQAVAEVVAHCFSRVLNRRSTGAVPIELAYSGWPSNSTRQTAGGQHISMRPSCPRAWRQTGRDVNPRGDRPPCHSRPADQAPNPDHAAFHETDMMAWSTTRFTFFGSNKAGFKSCWRYGDRGALTLGVAMPVVENLFHYRKR